MINKTMMTLLSEEEKLDQLYQHFWGDVPLFAISQSKVRVCMYMYITSTLHTVTVDLMCFCASVFLAYVPEQCTVMDSLVWKCSLQWHRRLDVCHLLTVSIHQPQSNMYMCKNRTHSICK